jgi:hypothetical protein
MLGTIMADNYIIHASGKEYRLIALDHLGIIHAEKRIHIN